jgi:ABC-2 type transport system permease protein
MKTLNAILVIAMRDLTKLLRDRGRIAASLIFPLVFIGVLGNSLNSNLSADVGFSFLTFVYLGVMGQTVFQSTASGIISLIEDRENDFSQSMFIAPVSRYVIILGKIIGESLVAMVQLLGIAAMGFIFQIPFTWSQVIGVACVMPLISLLGGGFGTLVMSNLANQKQANQIFPFLIFPQFFLSGIFSPITNLPLYLLILSRISPMTYAVDLVRSVYYAGSPVYNKVVLHSVSTNLIVVTVMFVVMMIAGTLIFVRNERNR